MYTQEEKEAIFTFYNQYRGIGLEELSAMSESEYQHVLGMRGLAHGLQEERLYINDTYKDEVFAHTPVTSRPAVRLGNNGAFLIRVNDEYEQVGKQLPANWKLLANKFLHCTPEQRTDEGDGIWLLSTEEWRAALPEKSKQRILTILKKAILR